MVLASLIGQPVLRLMVHQPMSLSHGSGGPLECFGAVALLFKDTALVLRSQLRYSNPRLADLNKGANARGGPTVSLCSHEEAQWLMESIGPAWRDLPTQGARLTAISTTATALRLKSGAAFNHWLTYREDVDGCWVYTGAVGLQRIGEIQLLGADEAFGWLLPESQYSLNWDGRDWPTLAAAWACGGSHTQGAARDSLFQDLYWLRLQQHPNLLRRFAALRYAVTCDVWPWLADQIDAIRQRSATPLRGQIAILKDQTAGT